VNELREGLNPELDRTQLFHNERGKTGELVGGSFALVVGFSSCRPSQLWIERTLAQGGVVHSPQSGTRFSMWGFGW
jgi:hypothetical protein